MKKIFLYKLQPDELEKRFLKYNLPEVKFQVHVMAGLIIVFLSGYIAIDFGVVKETHLLIITVTSRVVAIMAAFALSLFLPRINEPKQLQIVTFLIVIVVLTNLMIADAVRPSDQISTVAWNLIVIFTCYIAVPTSPGLQTASTLYYTLGICIIWLVIQKPAWSATETVSLMAAFIYVNICGFFISNRIAISRRHVFKLLNEEKSVNAKLEAAIKEIKTLQGILPICSYCKKIRNDKGYWDQLERYLSEHTDALFSHAVCPDCLKKKHPKIYDRLVKNGKIVPPDSKL